MLINFLNTISPYYYYAMLATGLYFFLMCLLNLLEIRRFTLPPKIFDGPHVSVLIPARNEEMNIERCLSSLRSQNYNNYEIIVLNDNSTDNTPEIISRIACEDSRVRVFNGEPLPNDWYGKPFAMHQLYKHAKGELLIFTDADTVHSPTSIAWAVTNIQGQNLDMISGYIGQVLRTFGEIITVPLMYILTSFALPVFLDRFVKVSWFTVAIGQFIVIRKNVLDAIGGCELFKKEILEDMSMSKHLKRKGYKTRFKNIVDQITCRMYNGYRSAVTGYRKNISGFFGKTPVLLFFLIIAVAVFFMSFPLLIYNIASKNPWTLHNLCFVCLFTLTWIFTFIDQRLKWWYSLLWPVSMLNLIYVAASVWISNVTGKGILWKNRTLGRRAGKEALPSEHGY